jgi:hypothetical protein
LTLIKLLFLPEPIHSNPTLQALSPASPKLSLKTSRDRSVSSLLSLGVTHRTPKVARRGVTAASEEKTVTIRCQRLTADKRYEEVDVDVPGATETNFVSIRMFD